MSLEATIEQDLKAALLAKDSQKVSTLRLLKSALLYSKVAGGTRGNELDDATVISVLTKEAKKRQESADLYRQGGNTEKADAELEEKAIIDVYLPAQMSEAEVVQIVDEVLAAFDNPTPASLGQIIGAVRAKAGAQADGGMIARLVKERISS